MSAQDLTLWGIRGLSLTGFLVFGLVFGLTYLAPERVERATHDFVVERIKDEIAGLKETSGAKLLRGAYEVLEQRYGDELERAKTALAERLPEMTAALLSRLCRFDCAEESKLAAALGKGLENRIAALKQAFAKFRDMAQQRYDAILAGLMTEIRIFTGSNLAVFFGLLVASFLAGPRTRYLVAPAALLLASTLVAVTFYLFEQNWFYTILFESYLGFGYLGYVAFLFLWFCDIVYLRARVTQAVINAVGSMISKCGFPA